jgi:glutamine kinase
MRLPMLASVENRSLLPDNKTDWLQWAISQGLSYAIPEFISFSVDEFESDATSIVERAASRFGEKRVFVRSSKRGEDAIDSAAHGLYLSVGYIRADESAKLKRAIEAVIASYAQPRAHDRVLLQVSIENVVAALGATSESDLHIPRYSTVSFAKTESSAAVTAGTVSLKSYVLNGDIAQTPQAWPASVRNALSWVIQLSDRAATALELEMAQDSQGTLWLLQVRPISFVASHQVSETAFSRSNFFRSVSEAVNRVLADESTVLSLMSDWNPAELIGERPRKLAADLFDYFIAKKTWYQARIALGYAAICTEPLLDWVAGRPYVNVRRSCSSLLPYGVTREMAEPYLRSAIARLRSDPTMHDKVESKLYLSAFASNHYNRFILSEAGFEHSAVRSWLDRLNAHAKLLLLGRYEEFCSSEIGDAVAACEQSVAAISNCLSLRIALETIRAHVFVPFAKVARLAFLAHSAVGSVDQERSRLQIEIAALHAHCAAVRLRDGSLDKRVKLARPGTFDIRIAIREQTESALGAISAPGSIAKGAAITEVFDRIVRDSNSPLHDFDVELVRDFVVSAIVYREHWKDAISHIMATLLERIYALGQSLGVDRETLSHASIEALCDAKVTSNTLCSVALENSLIYDAQQRIRLPAVLSHRDECFAFVEGEDRPNFLGKGLITGEILVIGAYSDEHNRRHELSDRIVAIESADPGCDWILAHRPRAFVTCFGGPHSHMAMRSAQAKIPCLLGTGKTFFRNLARAKSLVIDFDARDVRMLS